MRDLVEILDNYCADRQIKFVYGRKASLNLLDNATKLEPEQIYLMLEVFKRKPIQSNIGKVKGYKFTGNFFLVVNSNLDMPVFNEVGNDGTRSKYIENVKPLIEEHKSMTDYFGCTELVINNFEFIDVYDIFDQNKDGILVTFDIDSYEY